MCKIYIIVLDKTHTENRFLTVAEEVDISTLHVEGPACVLYDGTKFFGVTIGNLPPARF
jgi:hypothetical protein